MKKLSDSDLVLALLTIVCGLAGIPLRIWAILAVYRGNIRPLFGGPELHWQAAFVVLMFVTLVHAPSDAPSTPSDKTWADRFGSTLGKYILTPILFVLTARCLS